MKVKGCIVQQFLTFCTLIWRYLISDESFSQIVVHFVGWKLTNDWRKSMHGWGKRTPVLAAEHVGFDLESILAT